MTENLPSISVIIPVFNGAGTITDCLASLLDQNYPRDRYEILVVENCSTDSTVEIVRKFPVRLLVSSERGPAPARNLGIATSQADLVAFTDADCVVERDWLHELAQPFEDARVGGVAGRIAVLNQPDENLIGRFSGQFPPLVNFLSGEREFLPHLYTANACYRREPVVKVGGFHPYMVTAEDVDLSWRFQLQTSLRVCYAPNAVVHHRHRTTRDTLGRQYRQYGYGEILLDTIYAKYPGYPRSRTFQLRRMAAQVSALARYFLSALFHRARFLIGQSDAYDAVSPGLWLLIERCNLRGKLDALFATRFMTSASAALAKDPHRYISRFY